MFNTKNLMTAAVVSIGFVLSSGTGALAGTVTGGTLLSGTGADQLETWLGVSDQDFANIWAGDAGVATAASFHAAADGAGPTFSIYDVTIWDGSRALIGGYTSADWGWGGSAWVSDATAFIFNLTTGEAQFTQHYSGQHSILAQSNYFATFGGGADISGGTNTLGNNDHTYSYSYDNSQGQISIAGDSGSGNGDSGQHYSHITVNSLEVYNFAPAVATVPLPAGGLLLITALGGLAAMRRRKRQS